VHIEFPKVCSPDPHITRRRAGVFSLTRLTYTPGPGRATVGSTRNTRRRGLIGSPGTSHVRRRGVAFWISLRCARPR
jgi:hypothetical protein